MGDRLGHEGGVDVVGQGRLPDGALEQKHLIGQGERVAMAQVDLHLGGALLMDQGVHLELLGLGEGVDVLEQGVELIDRRDRIGPPARLGSAGTPDRRLQRIVRVGVALDQIELDLGRDDRNPSLFMVERDHPLEDLAGSDLHRPAVVIDRVVDDLGGGVARPGHQAKGGEIGQQFDVAVRRIEAEFGGFLRVFAGNRLHEDRRWQGHGRVVEKLRAGHDLASGDAGEVGNQAFDFRDSPRRRPLPGLGGIGNHCGL